MGDASARMDFGASPLGPTPDHWGIPMQAAVACSICLG
jgi:hypothetical protein